MCAELANPYLARYITSVEDSSTKLIYAKLESLSHPTIADLIAKGHLFSEDAVWDIAGKLISVTSYLHKNGLLVWNGMSPSSVHLVDNKIIILEDYFAVFRFWSFVADYANPFIAPELSDFFKFAGRQHSSSSFIMPSRDTGSSVCDETHSTSTDQSLVKGNMATSLGLTIDIAETSSSANKDALYTPRNTENDFVTDLAMSTFQGSLQHPGPSTDHPMTPSSSSFKLLADPPLGNSSTSMSVLMSMDSKQQHSLNTPSTQNTSPMPHMQQLTDLANISFADQRKADVWAIGVLLLCLCLCKQIEHGDNCNKLSRDMLYKSAHGRCPYTQTLCNFIHNCLQTDPAKRPGLAILNERFQVHMSSRSFLPGSLKESMQRSFSRDVDVMLGSIRYPIIFSPSGSVEYTDRLNYGRKFKSKSSDSPLIRAAEAGDSDAVKENMAYLGQAGFSGRTALMYSVINRHQKCTKMLLKEAQIKDKLGLTALMYAVKCNNLDAIAALLREEAGMQDNLGFTALMYAAADNNADAVALIIKKAAGKELRKQTQIGETALMLSTQHWNSQIAEYLNKECRLVSRDGITALMYAALDGNLDYVRVLASREAGITALNGDRALELALLNSHVECVEVLSKYELKLANEETPLFNAIETGNRRLLSLSAPIYCQNSHGAASGEEINYVGSAIRSKNVQALRDVLSFGSLSQDIGVGTCLDQALEAGNVEIIRATYDYVLTHELNVYVSPRPKGTLTTLMRHASEGSVDGIKLCLSELGMMDGYGDTALVYAVRTEKYDAAAALVCEAKIQNAAGWTPLMIAAASGLEDMVRLLASHSCGLQNLRMETALMMAVKTDHITCAQLLAKCEAKKQDSNGLTALMLAVMMGRPHFIELLTPLEVGIQDKSGVTALMLAAQFNEVAVINILVNKEATMQTTDSSITGSGWTSLMYAARDGNVEAVEVLKDYEANMQTATGRTALMMAAYQHNVACVEALLAKEIEAQDENGFSALMYAINGTAKDSEAVARRQQCIKLLLAETNLSDYNDTTPLILAASTGKLDALRILLANNASHEQLLRRDNQGMTTLMHAAFNGSRGCVEELLRHYNACIDTAAQSAKDYGRDLLGQTALMYAVNSGSLACVELLLPLECNLSSNNGLTALMHAAKAGHTNIVQLIIERSNELTLVDDEGFTALILAAIGGKTEALRFLHGCYLTRQLSPVTPSFTHLMLCASLNDVAGVQAGIQAGEIQKSGPLQFTALMCAAVNGSANAIALLAPHEAKITTSAGITALMLAARLGHLQCVKLLMEYEIRMQNTDGWTGLMFASSSDKLECVEALLMEEFDLRSHNGLSALDVAKMYGSKWSNEILHTHHASLRAK